MSKQITLADWLSENQITKQELGRRVGCSDVHIGRIAEGDDCVSQKMALRIFDETGVQVGPLRGLSTPEIAVIRRVNQSAAGAAA